MNVNNICVNNEVLEMREKNIGIVLAALLLAFVGVNFASVNPKLQLVNYSISEIPAQPGHAVNLTLVFKSLNWDNCAGQTSIQLAVSYPLSIDGPDTHYLGDLCTSDPDSKSTTSFILPVDPLAQAGTYQVLVASKYQKTFETFSDSNTLNVRVGGVPSFTASIAASNPVDVYPGDTAFVTAVFQNNGSGTVSSARVTFDASDGIEVKWAGQTQEIGQILPRGSSSATFQIEASKSLQPGLYHLYATLDYVSQDRTNGNASFVFDIPIARKADFSVSYGDGPLLSGNDIPVKLVLSNTGSEEARNIKASISPVYPFSSDGTVRYIDSITPGGSAELDYTIHVDKDAIPGSGMLTLLVNYQNPDGRSLSDTADFSISVSKKSLADSLAELWYVWVALAVAIVFFMARRRLRRRRSD